MTNFTKYFPSTSIFFKYFDSHPYVAYRGEEIKIPLNDELKGLAELSINERKGFIFTVSEDESGIVLTNVLDGKQTKFLLKQIINDDFASTTLQTGEPLFVTDTGKFYIGNGSNKVLINPTYESKESMFESPVFTGNPTAPTKAAVDNSSSLATTEFVKSQGYLVKSSSNPTSLNKINGWVDVPGFYSLKAWKDSDGSTHVQGSVMSGLINSIITTLSTTLRPTAVIDFPCTANNSGDNSAIRIYPNGDIQHLSGGNALISISVVFRP